MTIINFKIDGVAVPQGRPRAVKQGKGVRLYDPPKSKSYKQYVAATCKSYMNRNGLKKLITPLKIYMTFYFRPPKSYTKKRLKMIQAGEELFNKKPDADNLCKSILDGLNGILFEDDAQVVELNIRKKYSDQDYAEVTVEELIKLKE